MDKKLRWWGIGLTIVYLAWVAFWVFAGLANDGKSRWQEFQAMPLNNIGDFLAGVFSPLALLWLILGFFQQGHELRQSSEALKLQAQELQHSVDQQRQLVDVARQEHAATQAANEMQLARMREERAAADAAAQPRFIWESTFMQEGPDGLRWKFTIYNAGRESMSTVARSLGLEPLYYVGEPLIGFVNREERISVTFYLPAGNTALAPASGIFRLGYVDVQGTPRAADFEPLLEGKALVFLPV